MRVFTEATDPAEIQRAVDAGEHVWLDLPGDGFDPSGPVARALGVEREVSFAGAALMDGDVRSLDVTLFAAPAGLVTVCDSPCAALGDLRRSTKPIDAFAVLHAL